MEKMVGRAAEVTELQRCYHSEKSEFVIIYGRRRIGKTFLVNRVYGNNFAFYFTGMHNVSDERQLKRFAEALQTYGKSPFLPTLHDWFEAFAALKTMLSQLPLQRRKVIFFDEMPWIDHVGTDFVAALEDFWNGWAMQRDDIFFVACGSATSWMVENLVENQGGLHNRITSKIHLRPFTLAECEEYLRSHRCQWDRYQILQCYMYIGGIPFYLSLLDLQKSLAQNIDLLFFNKSAKLAGEFNELYHALFKNADRYVQLVRLLGERREGMTRQELLEQSNIQGSRLTTMLDNLETSDFIMGYSHFGKKKKGVIYRLKDFYTLFYLRFIEGVRTHDENHWTFMANTPEVTSWQGFSFELVCLQHIQQIKQALGLSAIQTYTTTWRSNRGGTSHNTQIDMLIERADRIINLCEMKFTVNPYVITKEYAEKIRMRMAIFNDETKNRKALLPTFVTTYGVLPNIHSGLVQAEVKMDDLFR